MMLVPNLVSIPCQSFLVALSEHTRQVLVLPGMHYLCTTDGLYGLFTSTAVLVAGKNENGNRTLSSQTARLMGHC